MSRLLLRVNEKPEPSEGENHKAPVNISIARFGKICTIRFDQGNSYEEQTSGIAYN
jgi:hypothetical protein